MSSTLIAPMPMTVSRPKIHRPPGFMARKSSGKTALPGFLLFWAAVLLALIGISLFINNNKENFVLDLFATWCGPCKIMLGNLEKVNESLIQKGTPKYSVYKFDIEQDMDLMKEWNVRGVPTIKIFENGEETFSRPGVMSPDQLLTLLD